MIILSSSNDYLLRRWELYIVAFFYLDLLELHLRNRRYWHSCVRNHFHNIEFMTREDKQLLERTMNSQFAVVWKWTYPPLKMLSHYTTSGLSSLTGRKGIGNLVFGPSPYRAASDLKTSILHFPEQWVGRTPPICPELGRWMDRSHVGEQGRRNGIRPRQRKRERGREGRRREVGEKG